MKRITAINNVLKIANKLKNINGLIGTPNADQEAYRVKRAYVFGSIVKGSLNPNDIDIAIEGLEVGLCAPCKGYGKHINNCRGTAKRDKRRLKNYGMNTPISTEIEALLYLKKGMKMVSLHIFHKDLALESDDYDIKKTKVMIYPRNDFIKMIDEVN